jgi:hypothetical protein
MAITINQRAWDFADIDITIDICQLQGTQLVTLDTLAPARYFKEINYSSKREVEDMYGGARNVQDQTEGRAMHEASMTVEKYGADYIFGSIDALGLGWGQVLLVMGIQFYKPGLPLTVDTIYKAAILGDEQAHKAGTEALVVPITLKPQNIYKNGRDVFGQTL